jgi:hypothetical protein
MTAPLAVCAGLPGLKVPQPPPAVLLQVTVQSTPSLLGSFETVAMMSSVAPATRGEVGGVEKVTEVCVPGVTVTLVVTYCDGAATALAWIVTTKLEVTEVGAV